MAESNVSTTKTNKQQDGAALSPKLHEDGLPLGKQSAEVARRYKHAAGKSSTYSPEVVDMIYHMAREGNLSDADVREFVAAKLDAERDSRRSPIACTWDQLVFLSANLTRLVIDPYREPCSSDVQIGPNRSQPLTLDTPVVYGGVDFGRLPESFLSHMSDAAASANLAVTVDPDWSRENNSAVRRIVTVEVAQPIADLSSAAAVEITAQNASSLNRDALESTIEQVRQQTAGRIPVGVVAPAFNAENVIDETVSLDIDFYVADTQWTEDKRPDAVFPELCQAPAIHVLADTVERLRQHRIEETRQVIYRGGIRNGADAGKALCLGATAVTVGLAAVVGMGFKLVSISDEAHLLAELAKPFDDANAVQHISNVVKSMIMEVTMLARACGKTSVRNMEPEDLRSLSIAVSAATGVPVAGKDFVFRSRPSGNE